MKKILLVLCLFFVLPNFAQNNQIYGISRNSNPDVTYLATVNTINGQIGDISDTSYAIGVANFSFTVDPILGIYYFSDIDTFIGLDMNTGELVHQNAMTTSQEPIFQNFMYNEITQEIIGLERGGVDSGVFLSKIDPATGVVTPISTSPFADTNTITVAGTAIDLQNQWYHVFSEDRILSVDISTGAVVHSPIVDTSEFAYFNNLVYNAADRKLYAIGRNNSPAELFFVHINPITGAVNTISPTSIGESIELEGSALDPFSGIYYFKRPNPTSMVGIDVNTGVEVSATPFDFSQSNGAFFGHFYFGGQTAQLLATDDFLNETGIRLYPNPTNDILQVDGNSISSISVYSVTGQQLVNSNHTNEDNVQLDVSTYAKGVYFLKVDTNNQASKTLKFVKK
ncbi:T9SS type A sorting domain-containing protein [uncultured Dokdonia sp.]|uniref:T9SS type A sorting domain-containing protein n=1 Tax=uncultured Dokdonia sp. TaxID=575653 RepID=UPI0026392E5C|nr:T9SS type A sorting domain-containing protein [uncultured Dokdonia sp.]